MVIDCFPFFNELDLLEIRLHELDSVVDRFIIVEGKLTFSNLPHNLVFPAHKERFARFLDRIDYLVMSDYSNVDLANAWAIEHAQKQVGLDRALAVGKPGDWVIYGDCDEIPKASAVRAVSKMDKGKIGLHMPLFYYHLNCRCQNFTWKLPKMFRLNGEPYRHRQIRRRKADVSIPDAGWHFSFTTDIKKKIDSFAHVEYARPPYNTPEYIADRVQTRQDLFGRGLKFAIDPDLSLLPAHVQLNPDKYRRLLA